MYATQELQKSRPVLGWIGISASPLCMEFPCTLRLHAGVPILKSGVIVHHSRRY